MQFSYRSSSFHLRAAVVLGALVAGSATVASATENGSSVYPVGVDTVFSAHQPARGKTNFYNYTNTYFANETDGANGKPAASADDAARDLAPIRNQNLVEQGRAHFSGTQSGGRFSRKALRPSTAS